MNDAYNDDAPDACRLFEVVAGEPLPQGGEEVVHDWGDGIYYPKGLVGDIAKWISDTSGIYQPKFALAAALTLSGALLGGAVKDYTGQRTNLFALAVGFTSAGKDAPIRHIQKLVRELRRQLLLSGEVTSDTAVENLLLCYPVRLMLLDEVGHYITSMKTAGPGNPHLRTVVPMLTKIWSAAQGDHIGKARGRDSNGKLQPPKTIRNPFLAVYGTSVPDVVFENMTESDFSDGSIPRYVFFISNDRRPFEPKPDASVPQDLVDRIEAALDQLGVLPHDETWIENEKEPAPFLPKVRVVEEDGDATRIFAAAEDFKFEKTCQADDGDKVLYLYGKAVENARRIALIVASFRNPGTPRIERYDADYAVRLMKLSIAELVDRVRSDVAYTKADAESKRVERIIRRSGEDGISKSELTRQTQGIPRNRREEILLDLLDGGVVAERKTDGSGAKHETRYWYSRQ